MTFVEAKCAAFYATVGRPSLTLDTYFRLLLIGYFEVCGARIYAATPTF